MPWRFDRVHVATDGTAWVSTTFSAEDAGGWVEVAEADELAAVLSQVLDDWSLPRWSRSRLTPPLPGTRTGPAEPERRGSPSTGWRCVVPGVLLGLVVGAVAARRTRDEEPRQVLISSEA